MRSRSRNGLSACAIMHSDERSIAMDNMKIYDFINSKDIRTHWEKIGYTTSPLEAAWLIWQSKNHTLQEKHTAWQELIDTTPDCEISTYRYENGLHSFLEAYMAVERSLIADFGKREENAVYTYAPITDRRYSSGVFFHTFEEAYADACKQEYDHGTDCLAFVKAYIVGTPKKEITVLWNKDKKVTGVDEFHYLSEKNEADLNIFTVFEDLWFKFPVPFQKGDLVRRATGKYDSQESYDTFVLTKLCTEWEDCDRRLRCCMDMIASGYFADENGNFYGECIHAYMDLEYAKNRLKPHERILIPLSRHMTGKTDIVKTLEIYRDILCKNELKNIQKSMEWMI